jgi:ribosome-associated translation inhibitor RaiA
MSTSTDDFVTYIQRKRNKGKRWKKKDARMKVYVKKKKENLTVNCHQVLQKYTKLQVNGEYKNIITH